MNWPTFILALAVAAILVAILARGIYNKKHHKGSCSCGGSCGGCPNGGLCHPEHTAPKA